MENLCLPGETLVLKNKVDFSSRASYGGIQWESHLGPPDGRAKNKLVFIIGPVHRNKQQMFKNRFIKSPLHSKDKLRISNQNISEKNLLFSLFLSCIFTELETTQQSLFRPKFRSKEIFCCWFRDCSENEQSKTKQQTRATDQNHLSFNHYSCMVQGLSWIKEESVLGKATLYLTCFVSIWVKLGTPGWKPLSLTIQGPLPQITIFLILYIQLSVTMCLVPWLKLWTHHYVTDRAEGV